MKSRAHTHTHTFENYLRLRMFGSNYRCSLSLGMLYCCSSPHSEEEKV